MLQKYTIFSWQCVFISHLSVLLRVSDVIPDWHLRVRPLHCGGGSDEVPSVSSLRSHHPPVKLSVSPASIPPCLHPSLFSEHRSLGFPLIASLASGHEPGPEMWHNKLIFSDLLSSLTQDRFSSAPNNYGRHFNNSIGQPADQGIWRGHHFLKLISVCCRTRASLLDHQLTASHYSSAL